MSMARITYTRVTLLPDGTVSYTQVDKNDLNLCRVRDGGSMIPFNGGASMIYHWGPHFDSNFTGEYYIRNVVKITEEE